MTNHLVRTTWYGRVLLIGGAGLTVTTGAGLWGWPEAVGESFAWEIKAPLTASWMGAWYLAAVSHWFEAHSSRSGPVHGSCSWSRSC